MSLLYYKRYNSTSLPNNKHDDINSAYVLLIIILILIICKFYIYILQKYINTNITYEINKSFDSEDSNNRPNINYHKNYTIIAP